jgi:hypothetical protein
LWVSWIRAPLASGRVATSGEHHLHGREGRGDARRAAKRVRGGEASPRRSIASWRRRDRQDGTAARDAGGTRLPSAAHHRDEAELDLPFAALQLLCAAHLAALDGLPEPQRDALRVAFGLTTGVAPDRLLVGLALLSLLSLLAAERPLLCAVDDTQWLDKESAQACAFVARRIATEPVAFLFAARRVPSEISGLREINVLGLGRSASLTLLHSVLPDRVDAGRRGDKWADRSAGCPVGGPSREC